MTTSGRPAAVPCSAQPGLLSEGPRWDGERLELLWVDIVGSRLHRARVRADGQLDEAVPIQFDRFVGAAAPAAGGGYVLAAGPGFLFLDDSGTVCELAQPEEGHDDVRMNDGACDPQGRFWAGTMAHDESPGAGVLYATLFFTTARDGLSVSELARQPMAGRVFCVNGLGVTGPPCNTYRGSTTPSRVSP